MLALAYDRQLYPGIRQLFHGGHQFAHTLLGLDSPAEQHEKILLGKTGFPAELPGLQRAGRGKKFRRDAVVQQPDLLGGVGAGVQPELAHVIADGKHQTELAV